VKIEPMSVLDAYRITPEHQQDRRGSFYEAWKLSDLSSSIGHSFTARQANFVISKRNTLRGIHGCTIPPGLAKLATCVRGAALNVVIDIRVGSPTFGKFDITLQEANSCIGVYLAEGLGHAFLALSDDTCMNYLCSTEYVPGTMIVVQAIDPELGIPWNLDGEPIRSDKDAAAPTITEAAASGLLPDYRPEGYQAIE
jgi:NDP-hexose 5-epimerase